MLIQNEERYVWYAVMSVINHVDKVLVWDTGSTDRTVEIIKEIKKRSPKKIDFKQVVQKDIVHYTKLRQEMLEATKADWFIIVDGDEVWWDDSIRYLTDVIRKQGGGLETIVSRYRNVVGDIYHYQEETAGRYEIDGKIGHLNIRAMNRNIKALHFAKPHGQQGIFDFSGKLVQERDRKKRLFVDSIAYLHFTNTVRSESKSSDAKVPKRRRKLKFEIGKSFPLDFYYPEVFFRPRPLIVPCVWKTPNKTFLARSFATTFLKKIKRRVFVSKKTGY